MGTRREVSRGERRSRWIAALATGAALAVAASACEPNVPTSDARTLPGEPQGLSSPGASAPAPARGDANAPPTSTALATTRAASAPATAPATSATTPGPGATASAQDLPAAPSDPTSPDLTSQGYFATVPSPDPADGAPFPIPSPLPDAARPTACDVAPPPRAPGGPVLRVIGKKGLAPGELAYPRAIAAARDGSAYYVVDKMGRIQKLDRELHVRAIVRTPEIARGKPTGLFVAASGELWVSDTHYSRVLVYSPDLVLVRTWGAPGDKLGAFLQLRDIKERGDGKLVAIDFGDMVARLQVFAKEGEPLFQFGKFGGKPGEFQHPSKVAIDLAWQELYLADSVNHRIQVLAFDGKPIREFGGIGSEPGRLKYPYDIALDADGNVWVTEFGNHRVQAFTRDGRSLATWGKPGRGAGELAFPWGLALEPDGALLLLDSGNDRIYELDRRAILDGPTNATGAR